MIILIEKQKKFLVFFLTISDQFADLAAKWQPAFLLLFCYTLFYFCLWYGLHLLFCCQI